MFGKLLDTPFPRMITVRQKFAALQVSDVQAEVACQVARADISQLVKPGARIAILAGSRGIARIDKIISALVQALKQLGAVPFIVPAMGSHGGATAEGQIEVLRSLGITEANVGAPIVSSMETVAVGLSSAGSPIFFDRNAFAADGIIPVGRVKPHTAFRFEHESGLVKMMTIGAGKQQGADSLHSHFAIDEFGPLLLESFQVIVRKTPVLFGLAIVENAYEQSAIIEAVPASQIIERDKALLVKARELMPSILFGRFDVLVIDQIGKNISGDGADPNITGRYATAMQGGSVYQRLAILDLTPETHGNALGVGMADVTTRRLVSKIDCAKGYMNALTSKTVLGFVKVPMTVESDQEAIAVALRTCTCVTPGTEKVVRIKTTLELGQIEISESLLPEALSHSAIEVVGKLHPMQFDTAGNLSTLSH
ncbi:MAG: hypothetical protein K0R22_1133 [Sporomusa sp.]|nr:hypothetical protein [Sporomusa sp.]